MTFVLIALGVLIVLFAAGFVAEALRQRRAPPEKQSADHETS
jgi:hypothetical protein